MRVMSNVVPFPTRRVSVIEVTRSWVHERGDPTDGEYCIVVVLVAPDGSDECVWAGHSLVEAIDEVFVWNEEHLDALVEIFGEDEDDDDDDDPDDGERMAA